NMILRYRILRMNQSSKWAGFIPFEREVHSSAAASILFKGASICPKVASILFKAASILHNTASISRNRKTVRVTH
ncbi:hypothetical protein D7X33_39255, partial [Butyricicoccus sp. 1XD8-22]